ncbi:MAG: hypothetical protein KIT02_00135 [Devosia sp.]|uniref:hypothetical protein n=1 Tax=Devosia sp. TaxID=1871048 RepID=UPI0024C84DAE|nr:hypothetical protein [Devosia sp.]UYN99693.1 MAG: hypothetical protein KIT02_00135 [Devosia sp.]
MGRIDRHMLKALGSEIRLATLSLKLDVLVALLERRYRPDQPRAPKGTREGGQWIPDGRIPTGPKVKVALAAVLQTQRVGLGDYGLVRHCIYLDMLGRQLTREIDASKICPPTIKAPPYDGTL